ncbi:MAG: hypothetical protein ACT4QA_00380 [Panacagrimonas sp.]
MSVALYCAADSPATGYPMLFARAVPLILFCAVLAGCPGSSGRFVKPVATPVASGDTEAQRSKFEDGYLRIFVSSNLDTNGRAMDFGSESQRPAMLLISAKFGKGTVASFASDADPEIPVLLYDVQAGKTVSSVVDNALLSEGVLVDPESLSKSPHLQILVRGVSADKAKWVTNLLSLATAEPILKFGLDFVPGGNVVSSLSTRLGELLSDEIKSENKPWEEKTLLGLRSEQGLAALDGRQFVVLLNSSKLELQGPAPDLRRCDFTRSATGLCESSGKPWLPAQAYVRFELDVTDFRSIKDFIGSALSCEADERTWADYRALLQSGQLARRQTQYERYVLARGELLQQIKRTQSDGVQSRYAGRLLFYSQQAALLPLPEDAYWIEHFRERASQVETCIRTTAVRGQSQYAAIWDTATGLYQRAQAYPAWNTVLSGSADPDAPALREAERELGKLRQIMAIAELRALDAASIESLSTLVAQLQEMLVPAYERVAEQIAESEEVPDGKRERLTDLIARSACEPCRKLLGERSEAIRLAAIPPPPAGVPAMPPEVSTEGATISPESSSGSDGNRSRMQ